MDFRLRLTTLVTATALLAAVSTTLAALNPPAKAKKLRVDLVRAYAECLTPNTQHNPPLTITACSPAVATSLLKLGPKGGGFVQVTVGKGPDIKLKLKVKDVRDAATDALYGSTVYVAAGIRLTSNDCMAPGDCTQIDLPPGTPNIVPITCIAGVCKGSATLNLTFPFTPPLISSGKSGNAHVTEIQVQDSLGTPFLVPGVYIP